MTARQLEQQWPHGPCGARGECVGTFMGVSGPAAVSAIRQGVRVKLCTRCLLDSDTEWRALFANKGENLILYLIYDNEGMTALARMYVGTAREKEFFSGAPQEVMFVQSPANA